MTAEHPEFTVTLNLSRGEPHASGATDVHSVFVEGMTGEGGDVYKLLLAGHYQIEGGYRCAGECQGRHPALRVVRASGTDVTIWP